MFARLSRTVCQENVDSGEKPLGDPEAIQTPPAPVAGIWQEGARQDQRLLAG